MTVGMWIRSRRLHLEGTSLAIDPEYGSEYWFVVDVATVPEIVLTGALPLKTAKASAERIAERRKKVGVK